MTEELWDIQEHIIPASHIRGFSRGIRDEQNGRLRLAVKQYTPKIQPKSKPENVTLIMIGGLGSSKELYEPFYDEILNRGISIRSAWLMDTVQHAASYALNEGVIGDEPNWFDSARDLLQMINHFQDLMPPPLFAIGFSWGSVPVVSLSVFHPRLFAGIVLIEPTFATKVAIRQSDRTNNGIDRSHRAIAMVKRRDIWPYLDDARTRLRKTPHYGPFDDRVFERVVKYDLRPASPEQCKAIGSPDAVTLATPKTMEVATMMRPDPPFDGFPEAADSRNRPKDIDTVTLPGFYRGEVVRIYRDLPYVLPGTLYLWAGRSFGNTAYSKEITERTGTGYGGNGGLASGRVQTQVLNDTDHNIPLDDPSKAADAIAIWLKKQLVKWDEETRQREKQPPFSTVLSKEYLRRITKL